MNQHQISPFPRSSQTDRARVERCSKPSGREEIGQVSGARDFTRKNPWRAPGTAPVLGRGCGIYGGKQEPEPFGSRSGDPKEVELPLF